MARSLAGCRPALARAQFQGATIGSNVLTTCEADARNAVTNDLPASCPPCLDASGVRDALFDAAETHLEASFSVCPYDDQTGTFCAQGDECQRDYCTGSACAQLPLTSVSCTPALALPCHAGACDAGACVSNPVADGTPCAVTDPCSVGTCHGGLCTVGPKCDDGNPNTVDTCLDGTCINTPK